MAPPSSRSAEWPREESLDGFRSSAYVAAEPIRDGFARLEGELETDVAVVGAGITGLSTALYLRRKGVDVAVLDAHEPGWGASGRNGGQVNPGLKHEPSAIIETFGRKRGEALVRAAGDAPDYLFSLVNEHAISCGAVRTGTIRVVRSPGEEELIRTSVEDWKRHGVELEYCGRDDLRELIGTSAYPAGLLDRRGGNLDPLAYTRGLAAAVSGSGGQVLARSEITRLERDGPDWRLHTAKGSVKACRVLLATNGYTDGLWPGLARTVIPVHSAIAASEPLPEYVARSILPGRQAVYETSWRVLYFRVDSAGRLLMGGPSALRDRTSPADYRHLADYARRLFPALRDCRWAHFWNGRVAVTADHFPQIHELAPGLFAALGYNGRGVAMATTMGRIVAGLLAGAPADALELPVTRAQPIRFHGLWKPVVALRRAYGDLSDRLSGH